ncbi:MAG TPA: hypothetical protein VE152_00305, partial [Acidimicrobiales bacterium]|nr:hypothetical protein [Acidimicrobiales bacterium]
RRAADLICLEELAELEASLPGFRFVPALSEAGGDEDWEGEVGLITDVVDRDADDLAEVDAYLCGPPPMIDAAVPVLEAKGVEEHRIFFDKFTISADAAEEGA